MGGRVPVISHSRQEARRLLSAQRSSTAGARRGGHRGEPDKTMKPLNPVSAAGLEHAVMRLNLGSAGVGNWTLGTPVSVDYP